MESKLHGFCLIAQEKLQAIICSIPGKKHLVIEHRLIKPLEHVCSASWLRLKGIQRIFKFDTNGVVQCSADQVLVFMISSRLDIFNDVLKYIQRTQNLQSSCDADSAMKRLHIICVPSSFAYFSTLLEAHGLYGLVQLHRFNWDFIILDKGVLSLEVPNVFSTVFLENETSLLPAVAQSMRVLQMISGRPSLMVAYGEHSANIVRILNSLKGLPKMEMPSSLESPAETDVVLLVDRDKDYASTLLTPAIYAGLLLEVFKCSAGELVAEIDTNKILNQQLKLFQLKDEPKRNAGIVDLKIKLNSLNDEIYEENRYKHFTQASSLIRAQAKAIGIEVQKLSDMKLEEMHEYVARKLPKITDLKTKVMRHLNASEKIIAMLAHNVQRVRSLEEDILNNVSRKRILQEIDELLTTDGQQCNTLRLLCLLHLSAGLDADELAPIVQNYCNYFGSKCLPVFQRLANGGLLPDLHVEKPKKVTASKLLSNLPIPKFQQTTFQANSNRLRLMASTPNETTTAPASINRADSQTSTNSASTDSTNCPSYVFNGLYIPLIAQLCALMVKFASVEDFQTKLGMLDLELYVPDVAKTFNMKNYTSAVKQNELRDCFPLSKRTFFIYVVGGVTFAEIAACNLIERTTGAKIFVASDSIISGSDLIQSAF